METEYLEAVKEYNKFFFVSLCSGYTGLKIGVKSGETESWLKFSSEGKKSLKRLGWKLPYHHVIAFSLLSAENLVKFQSPFSSRPFLLNSKKNLFCFSQVFSYSELWTECALIHSVQLSWMCYTQKYTQNWVELNAWVWVYKPIPPKTGFSMHEYMQCWKVGNIFSENFSFIGNRSDAPKFRSPSIALCLST